MDGSETNRNERTAWSVTNAPRHRLLLVGSMVVFLIISAFSTLVTTVIGLRSFRDVGYPDSATLLRIADLLGSGKIYSNPDQRPYSVTLYGPLTYVLLGLPYRLEQATGINHQLLVRLAIVSALCFCLLIVYLMSKRLFNSRLIALLSVLFAVSSFPLASWTTQIRGDLIALLFSLSSVYLFLLTDGRRRSMGAALCAGIALLVKQTFIVAPIAIVCWLIFRRRYKDAFLWTTVVVLTVLGGYGVEWWREPLMMKNIAALRHPILEYHGALVIIWMAVSQPVAPFAVVGGLLVLLKRSPERLLLLGYCIVAWLVAMLTVPQVGGYINYFWESFMASAILAGAGLLELQQKVNRAPILVNAMLYVMLLLAFLPMLKMELGYLRMSYANASGYQVHKARWRSFVSAVSGKRLLSTFPDVTVLSMTPELPDPVLNSILERGGQWNSGPVVSQIKSGVFDLVIVAKGEADNHSARSFRGVWAWDDGIWGALKGTYRRACVFEQMEIWLPNRGSGGIPPELSQIGCLAEQDVTGSASPYR